MKKALYKPQAGAVDINVNVYSNESCTTNSTAGCKCFHNDGEGCGVPNTGEGCGGIYNIVEGCSGGVFDNSFAGCGC